MSEEFEFIKDFKLPEKITTISQSCVTGDAAELRFQYEARLRGFEIFCPVGHSTKADIIVRRPHDYKMIAVQVKSAVLQHDSIAPSYKFIIGSGKPSCSKNPEDPGARYTRYVDGDFDIIAAYVKTDCVFHFYLLSEVSHKSSMRVNGSANNWEIFDQC